MTKPISRKMAVDCLLHVVEQWQEFNADIVRGDVIRCPECFEGVFPGQDIQFDHRHAIVHGGPHEYQNLRPVHKACHKLKSAQDVKANAKVKRLRNPKPSRHPMKSSGRKMPSRPFQKRAKP